MPSGIYFNTPQFSISMWIYPLTVGYYARVVDFGNGYGGLSDNILFSIDSGTPQLSNRKPIMAICPGGSCAYQSISSSSLILNVWQLLVATYDGTYLNVYINGTLTSSLAAAYTLPI